LIKKPAFLGGVLLVLIAGFDQLTKYWVLDFFRTEPEPVTLTFFWKIVLAFNRGVSFSLFSQETQTGVYLLAGATLLITLGLFVWLLKSKTFPLAIGLGLMIGGSLGNIVDRLRFGAVVDFLYFHWQEYAFPAFNIADCGITIGVGFILLDSFYTNRP
jgi:signal peptidase II